jgi:hypothetical protein
MIVFGIVFFVSVFILLISTSIIIINKKKIYYEYLNNKKLTSFDYLMDYDGNWLLKDIGLKKILSNDPTNSWLQEKAQMIFIFKWVSILTSIFLVLFCIIIKIIGIL